MAQFGRLMSALLLWATASSVAAFQLGQLTTLSRVGEPLRARVEIYGADITDENPTFELLPAITASSDGLDRTAVESIEARLQTGSDGVPFVELHSRAPIDFRALPFRLSARGAAGAIIAHYTIEPAPPHVTASTRLPAAGVVGANHALKSIPGGEYGPVRPGQTLWSILRARGYRGLLDAAALARVVADNPGAFVAGDPARLRVGAMLRLPARGSAATTARRDGSVVGGSQGPAARVVRPALAPSGPVATVAAQASANPATDVESDAAFAARLQALELKFAAIRAKYASQPQSVLAGAQGNATRTGSTRPLTAPTERNVATGASADVQRNAGPAAPPTAASAEKRVADSGEASVQKSPVQQSFDVRAYGPVAGGAVVIFLAGAGWYAARILRRRPWARTDGDTSDDHLVAEISRKAEKRVQLEGEIKRMLAGRREPVAEPVPASPLKTSLPEDYSVEEAENRIAHGQYSEAECMLLQVIARTPANHRAKLRLAEIYYLNERREEFVHIAADISSRHRAEVGDENWQRIMRMGKIIAPDQPPFSGPISTYRYA